MSEVLKLIAVERDFPGFRFGPVTLAFAPGVVHGLLGPNGAGKTTMLNLMALQSRPASGSMTYGSRVVPWADLRWKQTLAYVRETPAFYDEFTVADTLRFAGALHDRWDLALATRLANRFGLDGRKSVRALSKGTRVKLGLVLALAQGARLLLLDEPTAGVDPTSREELHDAIKELRLERPDLCVILSSHLFEDVNELADQFLILRDGQVAFAASRTELAVMSLYRLPEQAVVPSSDDIRLTWVSKGERWILLPRQSRLIATLRSLSGCVEDRADGLIAAAYRGTVQAHATGSTPW